MDTTWMPTSRPPSSAVNWSRARAVTLRAAALGEPDLTFLYMSTAGSVGCEAGFAAHDGGRDHWLPLRDFEVDTEGDGDLTRDVALESATPECARARGL